MSPEVKLKIACQSCQAKYTIADEKVVGKIVKIRCKKCGATIVINGNDPEATNPLPAGEGGSEWTVNVAEGDQRTMTTDELIDGYRTSVVTDETFCWKDGMADWLPLREIDEIYSAVSGGEATIGNSAGADFAPLSMRGMEDQQTVPLQREQMGGIFGGMGGGGSAHAESNGNGSSLFGGGAAAAPSAPASSPPAARRVGGRAGGADLFGSAAAAGGEEDVMTSAPSGGAGGSHASEEPGKLTGQRNENSVLFSLNALTSSGPKVEKEKPTADGSGLIDIRALSSSMTADTGKKKDHVDDIMNLGGGGAFNAPLAAPILAPPLAGADVTDGGSPVQDKQKKMLMMIIGAFGVIIVLFMAVVIYFVARTPKLEDPTAGGDRPAISGATAAGGTASAAPTDTGSAAVAQNTATPPASGGALPPGTGAVAQGPTHPTGGGGGGGGHTTHGGGETAATPTTPPATGGGGSKPPDLMGAMNAAGGGGGGGAAPATGGGGGSAPFDRGAAAGALGSIASSLQGCAKPGGPTGSGHAKITFGSNGNVKAVDVDQPPFQGSSVGGCVAAKFRSAHIPAFSGGDVPVGKSFNIN
ncbi:MAG: zinc-ribbon domain-containing protein [Polyangiaceae bacterium]